MSEPRLPNPGPFGDLLHALVEDRVSRTLDALVASHRNTTITPQEALSGIAMIAGLRSLLGDFAKRLRTTT